MFIDETDLSIPPKHRNYWKHNLKTFAFVPNELNLVYIYIYIIYTITKIQRFKDLKR